uniref:Uncharacterized protein n=1 Tax=Arundo donax TaxID=35708 RepID=A0A0A9HFJ3_ARUDO
MPASLLHLRQFVSSSSPSLSCSSSALISKTSSPAHASAQPALPGPGER